jgi:hypothetical protein
VSENNPEGIYMLGLLILAAVVVVGVVVWKLKSAGKVVTAGTVASAVEADAKAEATKVAGAAAAAVANTVVSKL